jgi:hypothetical protein
VVVGAVAGGGAVTVVGAVAPPLVVSAVPVAVRAMGAPARVARLRVARSPVAPPAVAALTVGAPGTGLPPR